MTFTVSLASSAWDLRSCWSHLDCVHDSTGIAFGSSMLLDVYFSEWRAPDETRPMQWRASGTLLSKMQSRSSAFAAHKFTAKRSAANGFIESPDCLGKRNEVNTSPWLRDSTELSRCMQGFPLVTFEPKLYIHFNELNSSILVTPEDVEYRTFHVRLQLPTPLECPCSSQ